MQKLKRKIWWYSLAFPLRIKSLAYRYFPPDFKINDLVKLTSPDLLQPSFMPYYYTYAYYPDSFAFQKSMGLSFSSSIIQVKRQAGSNFNPILVVLEALVSYNEYRFSKSELALNKFLQACTFLENYAIKNNSEFWIPYYQDYPKYGMKSPWVSGLTQALTLSVFLRKKSADINFLKGIFNSLWVPLEQGGVFTQHPSGYPWIAEYPGNEVPFVLNGQLSVIISLLEYLSFNPDEELRMTLFQMINGFFKDYPVYVFNDAIRYCWSRSKLASIHYQGLHAFQLAHLFQLTGMEQFKVLAQVWIPSVNWSDFARFHYLQQKKVDFITQLKTVFYQ